MSSLDGLIKHVEIYVISVIPFLARQKVFSCHVKRDFLSLVRTTSFPARLISVILCFIPFVSSAFVVCY